MEAKASFGLRMAAVAEYLLPEHLGRYCLRRSKGDKDLIVFKQRDLDAITSEYYWFY